MELWILTGVLLAIFEGLVVYRLAYDRGATESGDEVRRLTASLVRASAELTKNQAYVEGLWEPKECRQHVFPKEPVARKPGGNLKFLCVRCGEVRWTSKAGW